MRKGIDGEKRAENNRGQQGSERYPNIRALGSSLRLPVLPHAHELGFSMVHLSADDVLMAKFYVVDGLSYPGCETATGCFGGHGYKAMKSCRTLGFPTAKAKQSMTLGAFLALLETRPFLRSTIVDTTGLGVDPLEHYLTHCGFGVRADAREVAMARYYLVEGVGYLAAEENVGLKGKKGFESMYAVCKLGGFRGATDRGRMTVADFEQRLDLLALN